LFLNFSDKLQSLIIFCHALSHHFICRCPDDLTWRENFAAWYRDFGKYWKVYKQIRRAWDQIESYMKKRCPAIYSSLQGSYS